MSIILSLCSQIEQGVALSYPSATLELTARGMADSTSVVFEGCVKEANFVDCYFHFNLDMSASLKADDLAPAMGRVTESVISSIRKFRDKDENKEQTDATT